MDKQPAISEEDKQFHQENHHFSAEKTFDCGQITGCIFWGTNMFCIVGYTEELVNVRVPADISSEEERIAHGAVS